MNCTTFGVSPARGIVVAEQDVARALPVPGCKCVNVGRSREMLSFSQVIAYGKLLMSTTMVLGIAA